LVSGIARVIVLPRNPAIEWLANQVMAVEEVLKAARDTKIEMRQGQDGDEREKPIL